MDRITRKQVEHAFCLLAKSMGKSTGPAWSKSSDGRNMGNVGVWMLDYNPVYGGYVIEEMDNEAGGVSQPFGATRRSARDFVSACNFAMDAIRIASRETRAALESTMDLLERSDVAHYISTELGEQAALHAARNKGRKVLRRND